MASGDVKLCICHSCYIYLPRSSMPRFALANKLYRGCLPGELLDLTWIEEHVCARFSNTAAVTRLYQSSNPSQPAAMFRGNTCAHEMNVSSTVAVLPHVPSDVNDLLSTVFIGSRKFEPEYLEIMYRIQKSKVWRFLQWGTHVSPLRGVTFQSLCDLRPLPVGRYTGLSITAPFLTPLSRSFMRTYSSCLLRDLPILLREAILFMGGCISYK